MAKTQSHTSASEPDLFMAFVDGVYHHVCAECTALCCKGHGFSGSVTREMGQLFNIYPRLAGQVVARRADIVDLMTPVSGCHFLRSDNRCGIEVEHGKALKPGVCSLFPFNSLRRIGSTIAIAPHFMCPLRLQFPAAPGSVEGTHSDLATATLESGLLGVDRRGTELSAIPLHPDADPAAIVAREAAFRDRCARAIGRDGFLETLASATEDRAAFEEGLARASTLLMLDAQPIGERDALDDMLLAIASPVRLELLRLEADQILLALALAERSCRRELGLSGHRATVQDVYQHLSLLKATFALLGHGTKSLRLGRALDTKAPPSGVPELTFASFIALRALAAGGAVIPAFETAVAPSLGLADRMGLFQSIGLAVDKSLAQRKERRVTAR